MSEESRKNPEAAGGDVHMHPQREDRRENVRRVSAGSSARRGGYGTTGAPPRSRGSKVPNVASGRMTPSPNAPRNSQRFNEELFKRLESEKSRIIKQYDQKVLENTQRLEEELSKRLEFEKSRIIKHHDQKVLENTQRLEEELSKRLEFEKSQIIKHHNQKLHGLARDHKSQLSQLRESLHTMQSVHVKTAAGVSTG